MECLLMILELAPEMESAYPATTVNAIMGILVPSVNLQQCVMEKIRPIQLFVMDMVCVLLRHYVHVMLDIIH